jgi:hypothetical protein
MKLYYINDFFKVSTKNLSEKKKTILKAYLQIKNCIQWVLTLLVEYKMDTSE